MSGNSSIEWTDATWNPSTGCTKVSSGCDNCYAETLHNRFHGPGAFDTVTLHPERLALPFRWRKPRRVFVNSMSDLFHDAVPDEFIARVFAVMALTPRHTYQVLTKRHGRMRSLLNDEDFRSQVSGEIVDHVILDGRDDSHLCFPARASDRWPLENVWLGISVENQQWANIRIPALLDTPAAVRFLSCEPLLGPIELGRYLIPTPPHCRLGWVIVGAESGHGSRPMNEQWARDVKDACVARSVPFFLKQYARNGKKIPLPQLDGRTWAQFPGGALIESQVRG